LKAGLVTLLDDCFDDGINDAPRGQRDQHTVSDFVLTWLVRFARWHAGNL
jgi:hypothetical protein